MTSQELKDKVQIFKNLNEGLLNKLNIVDKRCKHLIEKHGFQKVIEQLKNQIYNNKSNIVAFSSVAAAHIGTMGHYVSTVVKIS